MSINTAKRDRRRIRLSFKDVPSMTEQAHRDEVSIHHIMRKFKKTGVITHVAAYGGTYMDYSNTPDYREAQTIIADAKSLFESVPSHIRAAMHNNAQEFVEFMQNEENREEIEAFGLSTSHLPPKEETTLPLPTPGEVVKPPVASPNAPQEPPETT